MSSYKVQREKLVTHLEKSGYLHSNQVKNAILHIPREFFIPPERKSRAYDDTPLPTYAGQTISAPHMNAMMCELLDLHPGDKVLEIGTGSGYHAALLGFIVSQGEKLRIEELFNFAFFNLRKIKMDEIVKVILGDGTLGYPKAAPYDKILVTAAGPQVPKPLLDQLAEGGKLCIPIGSKRWSQKLVIITKKEGKYDESTVSNVMFVPLIGEYGFESHSDD